MHVCMFTYRDFRRLLGNDRGARHEGSKMGKRKVPTLGFPLALYLDS